MATKNYTYKSISQGVIVTWIDLDSSDDGKAFPVAQYSNITVQHTSGAGTIAMEGSNDGGTTWSALDDEQGDAVATLAVDAFASIGTIPLLIRPVVTTGTNDVVIMVATE